MRLIVTRRMEEFAAEVLGESGRTVYEDGPGVCQGR